MIPKEHSEADNEDRPVIENSCQPIYVDVRSTCLSNMPVAPRDYSTSASSRHGTSRAESQDDSERAAMHTVHWQWIEEFSRDESEWKDYDAENNEKMENAYRNRLQSESTVVPHMGGSCIEWEVFFPTATVKSVECATVYRIRRVHETVSVWPPTSPRFHTI